MDSFVFAALCILCIIIPRCQGGRKEGGRKERGGNCAERRATADPDSAKWHVLDLGNYQQTGGGGGTSLWQTLDWKSFLGKMNLLLDRFCQSNVAGAVSLTLKSVSIFFLKSCHVWDHACGWAERSSPSSSCAHTHTHTQLLHRSEQPVWKVQESCLSFLISISPWLSADPPQQCWIDVWRMASAVFEGTSLVNMFVRDCWVNGIRRLIISQRGEEEEFFEIRTEWSDRNILYLHRSYSDLGRLFKRLAESFPEDRRDLSKSPLIEGWSDGK